MPAAEAVAAFVGGTASAMRRAAHRLTLSLNSSSLYFLPFSFALSDDGFDGARSGLKVSGIFTGAPTTCMRGWRPLRASGAAAERRQTDASGAGAGASANAVAGAQHPASTSSRRTRRDGDTMAGEEEAQG